MVHDTVIKNLLVNTGPVRSGLKLYRHIILGSTSNPTALAVRTLIPKGSLGTYFTSARMETQILNPPYWLKFFLIHFMRLVHEAWGTTF